MSDIINNKFPAARNFTVPACESCILARAKKRSTNTKNSNPLEENEGALSRNKLMLEILFKLINLFVRLLVVKILVMGGSQVIYVFKEVLFIMMLLIVWFGLKIKSL